MSPHHQLIAANVKVMVLLHINVTQSISIDPRDTRPGLQSHTCTGRPRLRCDRSGEEWNMEHLLAVLPILGS